MAKKVFTDESLIALANAVKSYVNSEVSVKADSSHTHTISQISDLTEASQSFAGLMSAEDKIKLDGIVDTDVYVQNEEPIGVPDGSLWIDMDGDGMENEFLPSYSTANNGQILTVVDGVATWQTIETWAGGSY